MKQIIGLYIQRIQFNPARDMNELREFTNSQSYIKFSNVDSLCAKKLAILREKKLNAPRKARNGQNSDAV